MDISNLKKLLKSNSILEMQNLPFSLRSCKLAITPKYVWRGLYYVFFGVNQCMIHAETHHHAYKLARVKDWGPPECALGYYWSLTSLKIYNLQLRAMFGKPPTACLPNPWLWHAELTGAKWKEYFPRWLVWSSCWSARLAVLSSTVSWNTADLTVSGTGLLYQDHHWGLIEFWHSVTKHFIL